VEHIKHNLSSYPEQIQQEFFMSFLAGYWEPDKVKGSLNGAGPSLQLILFPTGCDFCLLHSSGRIDSVKEQAQVN